MARRRDGTARRYDLQVFGDTEQGRVITERLDRIQHAGGSVSDFIREALWHFIQGEAGLPSAKSTPTPNIEREIDALWRAFKAVSPPPAVSAAGVGAESSRGLDLSPRRRGRETSGVMPSPAPPPPSPSFDAEAARERLLHSIKAYGQVTRRAQ